MKLKILNSTSMAYQMDKGVVSIHGKSPPNLLEKITRERIMASRYWKEKCFALNAADLASRAMELKYVAGTYGAHRIASPFICLVLKMLMIQPRMDIVLAFINETKFRYVRLLGAFYLRLVGSSQDVYRYLEKLYVDNRKFKYLNIDATMCINYIDDFVDKLLHEERVCETVLPRLVMRFVLEQQNLIGPRTSPLDAEQNIKNLHPIHNLEKNLVEHNGSDDEPPVRRKRRDESDEESPVRRKRRDESDEESPVRRKRRNESDEESPVRRKRRDESGEESPVRRKRRDESDEESPVWRKGRDESHIAYTRHEPHSMSHVDVKPPKIHRSKCDFDKNSETDQVASKTGHGGLKEMNISEMNAFRKSLGLKPLEK